MQDSNPHLEHALAQVRHDLKTPLNQILGYSELLLEEAADLSNTSTSNDLNRIRSASKALLNLINDQVTSGYLLNPDRVPKQNQDQHPSTLSQQYTTVLPYGHILVVDDQQTNREVLSRMLELCGLKVSQAEHGAEAVAILRDASSDQLPAIDVVLLDVMMPVQDGHATLLEIKSDPVLRHIPVIMISALDELDSVIRCIEIGAEDYLAKPFNPTLLKARLGASLEKKTPARCRTTTPSANRGNAETTLEGTLRCRELPLLSLPAPNRNSTLDRLETSTLLRTRW